MKIAQKIKASGLYRLIYADPALAPKEYKELTDFLAKHPLENCRDSAPSAKRLRDALYRFLLSKYHAKATVAVREFANLTPTVGRSVLAQRAAGTLTYTGTINYAAIGSGTTAPTNGDTQLGTEVYRQTMSSQTYVNNIAYLSCFIAAGTATGTHTEGGLFIDGTATVNTGQIFSRVLFSPSIAKTALLSLTLDVTITFT